MAQLMDNSLGFGAESTYGTAVTPTEWIEWQPDSSLSFDPQFVQGTGLRVGSYVDRSARRRPGYGRGELTVRVDILSKYSGRLFQAVLGTGTSTVVTAPTYQQLFATGQAGSSLPSLTFQAGLVSSDGTVRPFTLSGCVCMNWSVEVPEDQGPAVLEATFDVRSMTTATGLTTPVMPVFTSTSPTDYRARDVVSVTLGGTVVSPAAAATATGGTAVNYFRNMRVECDNNLDVERTVMGARQQPTVGKRDIKISATAEFADLTLTTAYLTQSTLPFTATFDNGEIINPTGPVTSKLQFSAQAIKLNSGGIPTPTDGPAIAFDFEAQVLDGGADAYPLYMVRRTADTTL